MYAVFLLFCMFARILLANLMMKQFRSVGCWNASFTHIITIGKGTWRIIPSPSCTDICFPQCYVHQLNAVFYSISVIRLAWVPVCIRNIDSVYCGKTTVVTPKYTNPYCWYT